MDIEEATEYIKMIIRKQEIPDSAKALGYVYATEAIETVLSELEKKEAIINEMAKHIHLSGDYECLNKECEDDGDISCEDCIKEYFYKKVKETKDNGSTRNV